MASPDQYNAFIRQVDLESVWLASAKIENQIPAESPTSTDVRIERVSSWGAVDDGFLTFDSYIIALGSALDPAATIEVTFGLKYRSELAMTNALFEPFKQFNLSLNAWPYAREFVASATARMNWIPFTLPALRLGAISPIDEGDDTTEFVDARATSDRMPKPDKEPEPEAETTPHVRNRRKSETRT